MRVRHPTIIPASNELQAVQNPNEPGTMIARGIRMPVDLLHEKSSDDAFVQTVVPLRVLVVDDMNDAAMLLGVIVRRLGHHVRIAHDGREALDRARQLEPEVVFLDIGLPDVNGYDICRTMRKEDWGARAIIVAVTGRNAPEDVERAMRAGFDRHVVKPMEFGVLREILGSGIKVGG